MKVWSIKLDKKAVVFGIIALLAILLVIIIATSNKTITPTPGQQNTKAPASTAGATEAERLAFIKQYGWTVSDATPEVANLYIPKSFDTVLENYNIIQKHQGFDLSKYRGQQVARYSYLITNYPANVDNVYVNLIVYNGKVIGGDVSSRELGGFMHGFSPARVTMTTSADSSAATIKTSGDSSATTMTTNTAITTDSDANTNVTTIIDNSAATTLTDSDVSQATGAVPTE